jgi:hypothetical protein
LIKKWLSYREHKLLGRPLTADELREVMNFARRIASILLLELALDANCHSINRLSLSFGQIPELSGRASDLTGSSPTAMVRSMRPCGVSTPINGGIGR